MAEFVTQKQAISPAALQRLQDGLFSSPFVGDSPLGGTFESSRGFALIFQAAGRSEVESRFPFLQPYLEAALDVGLHRKLLPWRARLRQAVPTAPNAFYLNLLLLGAGEGVGRHVDATLRDASGVANALPDRVFVLYLRVPPGRGGELCLFRHRAPVGRIRPVVGNAHLFRGDLAHEVRPFLSPATNPLRASLVLEQYRLPEAGLHHLPRLKICSKAGFSAYLQPEHRNLSLSSGVDGP